MRKLFLLLVLISGLNVAIVHAQTEKGTYLIGGNASLQASDGISAIIINPVVGKFLKDNFAVGANLTLYFVDGDNSFYFGPFAKYYFGKKTTGKFFGTFGLNAGGTFEDISLGAGAGAGYAFFLNKNIAFETGAFYNRFDESGIFTINLGFQIFFRR